MVKGVLSLCSVVRHAFFQEDVAPMALLDIDIHPLLAVAADVGPRPEDLKTRFCTTLIVITHGCARLFLMPEAILQETAAFPLVLPVTYQTHRYGMLAIASDADHPTMPVLTLLAATNLACLCGSLWHFIEQNHIFCGLMRHVPDAPLARFTPTERAIAALLARGQDEGEIAAQLHRSAKTVAKHCEHIRQKLNVHSHVDAILSMHAHHLVSLLDQPQDPPPTHARRRSTR
jgi:DNA-binding CsgD family transcriptional regulator